MRCYNEAIKTNPIQKICLNCNSVFFRDIWRNGKTFCSFKCSAEYNLRDRHANWKGGVVLQRERISRRIDRDGYIARYEGEHRIIAAREIGAPIDRGVCVVCLDRNNKNMSPDNLFLVPNFSELGLLLAGSVMWPNRSNLKEYRTLGYVRPDVFVVLHEWENGQRRESKNGNPITRHPQADEIIKRRRAGASASKLAGEFGYRSLSAMVETLKKRL